MSADHGHDDHGHGGHDAAPSGDGGSKTEGPANLLVGGVKTGAAVTIGAIGAAVFGALGRIFSRK